MTDAGAWFEPLSFGYGAGLPIAWQGWVVLGAYMLVVISSGVLLRRRMLVSYFAAVILATVAFGFVCEATTRGGWYWRSGADARARTEGAELTGADVVGGSEPKE